MRAEKDPTSVGVGTATDEDWQRGVKREFVLSFVNTDYILPSEENNEYVSSKWQPV